MGQVAAESGGERKLSAKVLMLNSSFVSIPYNSTGTIRKFRNNSSINMEGIMRKKRFSEHQIINILKQVKSSLSIQDVCRNYGVNNATYYNWKAKYGGMEASDVKKLKDLEAENRRLKQMYANLSLENEALKDILGKKL
ncbi:MAG: putative transposase [Desulforhopalus sp.]